VELDLHPLLVVLQVAQDSDVPFFVYIGAEGVWVLAFAFVEVALLKY